jgi:phage shock protein E
MKALAILSAIIFALLLTPITKADIKPLSQAEFEQLTSTKADTVVLDVRSNEEYANGYIKSAVNIPHTDIEKILATVNKDDTVIIYCRSGRRANIVATALEEKGYGSVHTLDGDIKGWIASGKPLEGMPEKTNATKKTAKEQ